MRLAFGLITLLAATPLVAEDKAPAPAAAVALLGPAVHVANVDRELHFYLDGLGMKKLMQMGPPNRRETMIGFAAVPGQPGIILLNDATATNPALPAMGTGFDRFVVRVSGLPEVVARLRSMNFAVADIRAVAKGYSMALATDPEGYKLELVESVAKQGN